MGSVKGKWKTTSSHTVQPIHKVPLLKPCSLCPCLQRWYEKQPETGLSQWWHIIFEMPFPRRLTWHHPYCHLGTRPKTILFTHVLNQSFALSFFIWLFYGLHTAVFMTTTVIWFLLLTYRRMWYFHIVYAPSWMFHQQLYSWYLCFSLLLLAFYFVSCLEKVSWKMARKRERMQVHRGTDSND